MSGTPSPALLARAAALVLAVVFFQIGVVSEVPVFGVNADLSPLLVAFVGLLCGSTLGAATGFAVGLLVDLTLLQTLGLTSLILTLVGYWAGRLRELRDPQAALTPLLVGAGAAGVSLVGYSLMEFMLGVDAPVSFELLRQIVLGTFADAIAALPMWLLVRRALDSALPETAPAPAPARLHDRGAQPPLQSMSAIEPVRPREPRLPVAPGMATRVAIIGAIAMAMFAVIFFRLWYLQVLSGEQYVRQADNNRVRDLPIPAPRGQLLDREGQAIVSSRTANAVQIVPSALPDSHVIAVQAVEYQQALEEAETAHRLALAALSSYKAGHPHDTARNKGHSELDRLEAVATRPPTVPVPPLAASATGVRHLFARLGRVLGMRARTVDERVVRGMTALVYAPVTIRTDAGLGVLTYLGERGNEFPGVLQQPVSVRNYLHGEMAAQAIGHVDQISEEELKLKGFRGVEPGTIVGQEGLEYYYDRYLRGKTGVSRVEVNAEGYAVPSRLKPTPPQAGRSLKLTLSLPLQKESEKALMEGIDRARAGGKPAVAGSFVALDPRNGSVLSIGSYPSYNPNRFAKPLSKTEYEALAGGGSAPGRLTDRAVNGQYPTGSTFKPITALAALESGVITPGEGLGAGQCIHVATEPFCNAGHADYGAVGLVEALKVSSDTYFFEVGERANAHGPIIQDMARKLGIGEDTGIDLPSEFPGVIPEKKWREEQNALELKCERQKHVSNCGIVEEPTGTWTVGNNMDLAVGQGELLTDPLQMALAYSTLANAYMNGGEGTVVRPHLGEGIYETTGGLVQSLNYPPTRKVHLNYADLSLVMEGIHEAASAPHGTSAEVWAGWNQSEHPVFGKTGTAQHFGHEDQSWYLCYIADPKRPIVIAVTVEEGGFGAETAAPIARLMASQWFGKQEKFIAGSSKTL